MSEDDTGKVLWTESSENRNALLEWNSKNLKLFHFRPKQSNPDHLEHVASLLWNLTGMDSFFEQ